MVARLHDLVRDHLDLFLHLVEAASHEPLDGENRVLRVGDGLALCDLADQSFSRLGDPNDRWGRPSAFFVRDHFGLATLHDRHARIGGSQVNSNNLGHKLSPVNFPYRLFEYDYCFVINLIMIANSSLLRPEWNAVKV